MEVILVMYEFTQTQIGDMAYFRENINEFLKDNALRFKQVIVSNKQIVKSFDGLDKAVQYAVKNLTKGEYIIQQVVNEDDMVNFV
jgi:hypothetical protein